MINNIDLNNVNYWNTKVISKEKLVYDIIVLNLNGISIDLYYLRNPSLCFLESLKDYIMHYSHDIKYIKELAYLKQEIIHKYKKKEDEDCLEWIK